MSDEISGHSCQADLSEHTAVYEAATVDVRQSSCEVPHDLPLPAVGYIARQQRCHHFRNVYLVSAIWTGDGEVVEQRDNIVRPRCVRGRHTGLENTSLTFRSGGILRAIDLERHRATIWKFFLSRFKQQKRALT